MVQLLLHRFVPDYVNTDDPLVRTRYGILSGAVGIGFNILLFIGKLMCGVLSGSIAIIADAFNNLSDAGSSIITLFGFRMASQEADEAHPFGHGRIEYLTGLVVSVLILLVGFTLARESVGKILHPTDTRLSVLMIAILLVSIGVKFYMFLYNHAFAVLIDSVALSSTAADSRNDAITTAIVLLSQVISQICGFSIDGWTGLAVALFILVSGWKACLDTIGPLLGQEPDPKLVADIEKCVLGHKGVLGIHDLIIHDYGPGRRMMTLHIEVSENMTLHEAHELADRIEMRLNGQYHIETVIHVDPIDVDDPETRYLQEKLKKFLSCLGAGYHYHDLRLVKEKNHKKVFFDVAVPFGASMKDEEILQYLTRAFRDLNGHYRAIVTIDHYRNET